MEPKAIKATGGWTIEYLTTAFDSQLGHKLAPNRYGLFSTKKDAEEWITRVFGPPQL